MLCEHWHFTCFNVPVLDTQRSAAGQSPNLCSSFVAGQKIRSERHWVVCLVATSKKAYENTNRHVYNSQETHENRRERVALRATENYGANLTLSRTDTSISSRRARCWAAKVSMCLLCTLLRRCHAPAPRVSVISGTALPWSHTRIIQGPPSADRWTEWR